MTETTDGTVDVPRNEVFETLAHERRRAILRILDRLTRAKPEELATHLVAEETDTPLMEVTPIEAEQVRQDLTHVHLPQLEDAGLVTRRERGITTTAHPALQDPKITRLIETDAPDWDAVLTGLADKRRRIALSMLYRHEGPMDRVDLATQVTGKLRGDRKPEISVEAILQNLHHVHLPKLEVAGLVTYDVDAEMATYEGHPDLDEEWLVAGTDDTPRAILSMAHKSGDIWTLEGRDNVTERGRALCESAQEELFMMFTLEGTVETACVRRIQDALDRGVDVYLGTQNKQLRDLIREHAPEVVIWEPQLDWLNLPPSREKVGRLIMADREELLIGTIGEAGPDGIPNETAITGAGEDNPLVMLLREMLGSRLDHLDAQSEDFLSELPL
jgi:DNA-binding transcriptional ArsR family regulator